MCGIVGACDLSGAPVDAGLLRAMSGVIAHRGPDGEGYFIDGAVGFGHRRLAIIDPSPAGNQPMESDGGDVVLNYNGEVYNFRELRAELEALGWTFRSRSDTEVVLHAYEQWGEECVRRFNGMFAFAVYDRRAGRLFLARDRYGIKPLYWFRDDRLFLFASEIKALLQHPAVRARVCYPALSEYFTFQNVFSDLTLFEGVRLLPAGCTMTVDVRTGAAGTTRYWDFQLSDDYPDSSLEECAAELGRLFERAVTRQLVADVPVGSYLSGGMDSGSITAVATRHIPRLHTFSAGFDLSSASGLELAFDERPEAELMSNVFKTEHYEVVLHAGDMEHVLPDLIWHLEDLRVGQCYPNFYTARLAGRFVKVVLSGAGGDELFAGYPWRYYRGLSGDGDGGYLRAYYDYWQRLVPDEGRAEFFTPDVYARVKEWEPFDAFRQVFGGTDPPLDSVEARINASLYFELKTFLHGLFVVEDRVSMAHSLETRVPFTDNDLVDFALRLGPRFKLRDLHAPHIDEDEPAKRLRYQAHPHSDGKLVLRKAMAGLIPRDIVHRAKQGFSAPDASWFRGESISYVDALLRDPKARIHELISRDYVHRVLDEHCGGRVNHRLLVWSLLSFEWWLRLFDPVA